MNTCALIKTYGRNEASERYFIGIWVASKCEKKFIDYGTYLRILEALAQVNFEDYQHTVCIDVVNLPISKLYFDIDCKMCKLKKHGSIEEGVCSTSWSERLQALDDLTLELSRLLNTLITKNHLTVAVKSKSGCGLHVTVDVYVDFVARYIIANRLNAYELGPTKQYICDNPTNVLVPGGRGYDSLCNLRTHTLYTLTLEDAINRASVVLTSEQLKNHDHVSVCIQNTPSPYGCIEWLYREIDEVADASTTTSLSTAGMVYVINDTDDEAMSNSLILSRVVLWERIKTFVSLAEGTTANIVALKFNNSQIPIKWFNHSTMIIAKSLISQYHIRESNAYPCTKLSQIQIVHTPNEDVTTNEHMDVDVANDEHVEFKDSSFFAKFTDFCANSNSTSNEVSHNETVTMDTHKWRTCLPYTTEEVEWMNKYNVGKGRNAILSDKHAIRLYKYTNIFLQWWTDEGNGIAQTCAKLVDILLVDDRVGKQGNKKRKTKCQPEPSSSSSNSTRASSTTPPKMQELFNIALKKLSITSTVSFIMRITRSSVEDACLMVMLMGAEIILEMPTVEFILVRLATAGNQLTNYLMSAYRGCDWFYLYILEKTSLRALAIFNRVIDYDSNILIKSIQVRNLLCLYILNCSKAGDKILLFDGDRMHFMVQKELKEVTLPHTKMVECECAYSYRCNYGIYNPYTRIIEAQGPSLIEVVWRIFATPVEYMAPNLAIHELALNYMSKIPSFIEYLQSTTLYHTLVAPLWPIYETYPSTHEYYLKSNQQIDTFAVTTFQTLLDDLTLVIQKHTLYPNMFPKHFLQYLNSLPHLRRLVLTIISTIYTLNAHFNIVYETPSMLISKLFGTDYWQCIGTQFHCTWNQKDNTISKESRVDQLFGDITESASDFNGTDTADNSNTNSCVQSDEMDDPNSVALIRRLLNCEMTRREVLTRVAECIDDNHGESDVHVKDFISPICERPLKGIIQKRHVESVSETIEYFKQINVTHLLRPGDSAGEEFLNRIDVTYQDVNLYALLVTAWFIRMGDDHRLNNTAIFKYINNHRKILYEELCNLADELVPHGRMECITSDSLIEVFKEFDRNTEIISPPLYNNTFDTDKIIDYYEPSLSCTDRQEVKHQLMKSVPEDVRNTMISALMELLRSSNYNFDLFMEFTKLIGYCEYLGNPLRIGINLYGSSGSGKTSLLSTLAKTFNTSMPSNLTSKQFKEAITGDNDPNARTIGMNFICHMNEENVVLVSRFKSYVDVGFLVTRDCHATEVIEFPIRAKVVFCTNEPVQVENATDDGFHQRYYPIPLAYSFKDYESGLDRVIRHRVENLIPSMYLGGQLLMNLHTSGRTVNFSDKLEFVSHHLFSTFFFNTLTHPIPKIQTCHVRNDYLKYFSRTNPLILFTKHAHIEYSHLPLSENRLQEILETWWENNKIRIEHKFAPNSSFSKWLNKIDYFHNYKRNDEYYMRIYFNRLYNN